MSALDQALRFRRQADGLAEAAAIAAVPIARLRLAEREARRKHRPVADTNAGIRRLRPGSGYGAVPRRSA